jgi:hypothetical protein
MDINKIFNLFDSDGNKNQEGDCSSPEENQRLVDMFKDHPIIKISYFKKLVKNYSIHSDELAKMLHKTNKELDILDIKAAGEFILFTRAWENIACIDINNKYHLDCLVSLADENLLFAFNFSIKHFEKLEEYERCGFIKILKEKVFFLK